MDTTESQPVVSAPPTGPSAATAQYEFNPEENAVFRGLAGKMNFVGVFTLAVGILVIVIAVAMKHPWSIFPGVLYAVVGLWTQRAGDSFRGIADTQGKDISHLMHALGDLHKLYNLQLWLCLAALVSSLVVTVLAVTAK